jgi:filamentous hemagglutinin family protein
MHRDRRHYAWAWLRGSTRYSAQTKAWLSLTSALWLGSLGAQSSPAATAELPMPDWLPDSATPVQPDEAELDLTAPVTDTTTVAPDFTPAVQFSTPVSPPPTAVEALPPLVEVEAIAPRDPESSDGKATAPPEPTPVMLAATTANTLEAIAPVPIESLEVAPPAAEALSARDPELELTPFSPPRVWESGAMPVEDWDEGGAITSPHPPVEVAQLIPDQSLGAESSVVVPGGIENADLIEGGASRGGNLFHSFQEFNVNTGQAVYFANPINIENILTRVTGNNISNIDGLLGVTGAANLFLLNPNGVTFGPNARLDIGGSFTTSTGSSFTFADGSEFSAVPQANELLSFSVPLGVQFNNPQGDIASTGNLETGQDLNLVGNNLYLEGQLLTGGDLTLQAADTVQIRDATDLSFVAAAGSDLLVQGNQAVDIFALNHADSRLQAGSDLTLRSPTPVIGDAHYRSGGNFRIEQLDESPGALLSPNDPVIRANGECRVWQLCRGVAAHPGGGQRDGAGDH